MAKKGTEPSPHQLQDSILGLAEDVKGLRKEMKELELRVGTLEAWQKAEKEREGGI